MNTPEQPQQPPAAPVRTLMQQAALPKFRIPFYTELAARPTIDLDIIYGTSDLPNVTPPPGLSATNAPTLRIPGGFQWDREQRRRIKSRRYAVATCRWNTRILSLFPAIRLAKRRGMGVVLWGHGYSKDESHARAALRLKAARAADTVCFYTQETAERYLELGIPQSRVFVALNSLDQKPIQAARDACLAQPDELQRFKQHNRLDRGPVVLFVSRLFEPNRTDRLLHAAISLRDQHPNLRAIVIGSGPDEQRLKSIAKELDPTAETITFTGAIYDEARLAPWFCSATAFCYPQNIGLSILHAMGYALPIVTSDKIDTQNPEIAALKHNHNGMLYNHGSNDDLARTLHTLFTDQPLQRRLSKNAHHTATTKFNIETMATGMEHAILAAKDIADQRNNRTRA